MGSKSRKQSTKKSLGKHMKKKSLGMVFRMLRNARFWLVNIFFAIFTGKTQIQWTKITVSIHKCPCTVTNDYEWPRMTTNDHE